MLATFFIFAFYNNMINFNLYRARNKSSVKKPCFTGAERLFPYKQYPKKAIKLLVLDVDGTISDRISNLIHPDVKTAIKSVIQNGIRVILNTGRDYEDAKKIADEISDSTLIITNYGKYIYENGKIVYENPSQRVDLKGDSLEYVANSLGFKKENIMSIGNDVEDISMFKKSGTSVLVENSNNFEDIVPFANYIVDNKNKSGVALAIKKLILD